MHTMQGLSEFASETLFPSSLSSVGISAKAAETCGSSPNPLTSLRVAGSTSASSFNSMKSRPTIGSSSPSSGSFNHGKPFVEMVRKNDKYGPLFRVPTQYKLKLMHGQRRNLHWFLLLKVKKSDLPYLTLEITTSDLSDLLPTIRTIPPSKGCWAAFSQSPEKVGIYEGTLQRLCQIADDVVKDMKSYNLLTSNCQHFCNNVLKKIEFETYPTTIGPETTLEGDDRNYDLLTNVAHLIIAGTPALVGQVGATAVGAVVGAPSVAQSSVQRQRDSE